VKAADWYFKARSFLPALRSAESDAAAHLLWCDATNCLATRHFDAAANRATEALLLQSPRCSGDGAGRSSAKRPTTSARRDGRASDALLRATLGVAALLQRDFQSARVYMRAACAALDAAARDVRPAWLPPQASAAIALANHAAAVLGAVYDADGLGDGDRELTVSLLRAALDSLPTMTPLHMHLAACLRVAKDFPNAMAALHCALCLAE